MHKLAHPQG
ncbi:hypothetical protein M5689_020357 [Euphorbia peplus]|nr:hypothetical protein M5689_020357 [Euphorbia peplus]